MIFGKKEEENILLNLKRKKKIIQKTLYNLFYILTLTSGQPSNRTLFNKSSDRLNQNHKSQLEKYSKEARPTTKTTKLPQIKNYFKAHVLNM